MLATILPKRAHDDLAEEVRSLGYNARAIVSKDGTVFVGDFALIKSETYKEILQHFQLMYRKDYSHLRLEDYATTYVSRHITERTAFLLLQDQPNFFNYKVRDDVTYPTVLEMVRSIMKDHLINNTF